MLGSRFRSVSYFFKFQLCKFSYQRNFVSTSSMNAANIFFWNIHINRCHVNLYFEWKLMHEMWSASVDNCVTTLDQTHSYLRSNAEILYLCCLCRFSDNLMWIHIHTCRNNFVCSLQIIVIYQIYRIAYFLSFTQWRKKLG